VVALWEVAGKKVEAPFLRMTYDESMERFGCDRPDLRFGFEIEDLGELLGGRGFTAFDSVLEEGGRIRGIRVSGGAVMSRKDTDRLTDRVKAAGLGGMALLKRKGDELSGPLARLEGMTVELSKLADGDLLVAVSGSDALTSAALDSVRNGIIERMAPEPSVAHAFLWVDDFPLFEADEDGGWTFAHHPFTSPAEEDMEKFWAGDVGSVKAQHYDLVYNGNELGSGSIRIADPKLQLEVFRHMGIDAGVAEERFGWLLNTLRGGVPPHGGMALGVDRIVMLLAGAGSLRDVIAFPKTTAARALFESSPAIVAEEDLKIFGLRGLT
jgi:aspartyl-tRNA synthetase